MINQTVQSTWIKRKFLLVQCCYWTFHLLFSLFPSGGGGVIFGGSRRRKVSRTSRNSSVISSPFFFQAKRGLKFRGTGKFPRLIVQRTAKYFGTDRFTDITAYRQFSCFSYKQKASSEVLLWIKCFPSTQLRRNWKRNDDRLFWICG